MNIKRALRFVASRVVFSVLLGIVIAASTLHISTTEAQAQVQNRSSSSPTEFNANSNARPQSENSPRALNPNLVNNIYQKCVSDCKNHGLSSGDVTKCIEGCAKIVGSITLPPDEPGITP